ncbi:MAG: signal peptidase I [Bifidobacteriaceae bacterium]|jgi:signal peptidase|nr:signal peptidase I [Bifidobacteriaceae bacterium]
MLRRAHNSGAFISGFLSTIGTVIVVLLAALAIALVAVPKAAHGAALTVLTGSMEPTFSPGDVVVVKGVTDPVSEVAVGDVITYLPYPDDPTLITHRVVGKSVSALGDVSFITQGDANNTPDDPVMPKQIRGSYLYAVPYIGYATSWFSGNVSWLVTAVGVGLIIFGIYATVRGSKRRQNPAQPGETQTAADQAVAAGQTVVAGQGVAAGQGFGYEPASASFSPAAGLPVAPVGAIYPEPTSSLPAYQSPAPATQEAAPVAGSEGQSFAADGIAWRPTAGLAGVPQFGYETETSPGQGGEPTYLSGFVAEPTSQPQFDLTSARPSPASYQRSVSPAEPVSDQFSPADSAQLEAAGAVQSGPAEPIQYRPVGPVQAAQPRPIEYTPARPGSKPYFDQIDSASPSAVQDSHSELDQSARTEAEPDQPVEAEMDSAGLPRIHRTRPVLTRQAIAVEDLPAPPPGFDNAPPPLAAALPRTPSATQRPVAAPPASWSGRTRPVSTRQAPKVADLPAPPPGFEGAPPPLAVPVARSGQDASRVAASPNGSFGTFS